MHSEFFVTALNARPRRPGLLNQFWDRLVAVQILVHDLPRFVEAVVGGKID